MPILKDVSFTVENGAVVGIVGANGTGKSTLLRLLSGSLTPEAGSVVLGESVVLGHVSQKREDLNPTNTVFQEISGGDEFMSINGQDISVRAYTSAFNLKGPAQEKLVGSLSGGERNRVHLAKTLRRGVNLIMLDEQLITI